MNVHNSIPFLIVLFLSTLGCVRKEKTLPGSESTGASIVIKGTLEEGAGKRVMLEEMGAREYIGIDTVNCDDSGAFEIAFTPEEIAFYVLRYGPAGYITLLMEPGEVVEFSGVYKDQDTYALKGSPGSELLQSLATEHRNSLEALGEIGRKNRELVSSLDYPALKQDLDRQFDSITNSFHDYSLRFIQEHSESLAILIALYNLYGQGLPVFQPEADLPVYQFVDSVLMQQYSKFEAVQLLHAQVSGAGQIMDSNKPPEELQEGEIAPDFVSSRPDGSTLALSDLKGNYVLLSFWAGWSRLSRDENGTLRRAHDLFAEKKFRILQVSVDDNRDSWTGAISEDRLNWDHVSELRRWDTPVADLYRVEKIPYNVLIDPSGRIVGTGIYGEQLLSTLEQLLKN